MNALKAGWMMCATRRKWFRNAGNSIVEATTVDFSSRIIELFDEAFSHLILDTLPLVRSNKHEPLSNV